jgi:primosomal protein N' (replication factor Y) (superfamily II helicase)
VARPAVSPGGQPAERAQREGPLRERVGGRGQRIPAEPDPVARVVVDVPLAHLDRPFDYLVPAALDEAVRPGSRVRVRFAGQLVDGIVIDRATGSEHDGRLSWVERSVSPEQVLSDEVARLARAVADRWAGSLTDVLRLAIPPRHARVEAEPSAGGTAADGSTGAAPAAGAGPADGVAAEARPAGSGPAVAEAAADARAGDALAAAERGWRAYRAGEAWLRAVGGGRAARAVWSALPGEDWPVRIAEAVGVAVSAGRGALIVVPDRRDLARVDAALGAVLGAGRHVALAAELGPAERYRRWLAVRRGAVRVAAGTRAAAFAPVADLGLIVIWDDGDDLHAEPRAPYPHARDLLVLRAHLDGAAMLIGAFARTAEAQQLVESGWAHELVPERAGVPAAAPRVVAVGDDAELARDPGARSARLPAVAWRTAKEALAAGAPVLVQVPRRGYLPALACARCRAPARCAACHGELAAASAGSVPACRWCGRPAGAWQCAACGNRAYRAVVVGAARTAEELGRAFPGVAVRTSGGRSVLDTVPPTPALVVATPGAEPRVEGRYGAALLLDGWALLTRPDLRAAEETLRRWMNAAALVRPAAAGGRVVVGADGGLAVVQALLRWDPGWHAERELAERAELGFPPATRFASVTGPPAGVADLLDVARLPEGADLLGPVPAAEGAERLLVRVPRADGLALAAALRAAAGVRSARKAPDPVRIQLDPAELL